MSEKSYTLTMKFNGTDQKTKSMNLTDFNPNIEDSTILYAMQQIIEADVLTRSGIHFESPLSAVKTMTEKTEISFE